jgi:hypothetical protein
MRRLVAILIALAAAGATVAQAGDRPSGRVDAQMLLDLDLLAEGDPARHHDQSVAERMRMLEMLRLLESPPAAAPARSAMPAEPRSSTTSTSPGDGGAR